MATVSGDITTGITLSGTLVAATAPVGQVVLGNAIEGQIVGGPKGETGDQGPQGDPGVVQSVVAGTNVTVDSTDPANPIVSANGDVTSVNGQTGVVVLDADDIDDTSTTHKFVTSTDLTKLANTSGTNTGDQDLSGLVPNTRTVNGKALGSNVTLTQDDIGDGTTYKQYSDTEKTKLSGIEANADVTDATNVAAAGAFIKSSDDTDDITDTATNRFTNDTDISRLANTSGTNTGDQDLSGLVPKTTTVNGHALSSNVTVTKSDVGLGNVDNTSDATKNSAIATLTNKRITERVTALTSSATPTINTDDCDAVDITALATDITSMTTNLTGTPTNKQKLIFEIKDDGNARAISWDSAFIAGGVSLPTTTVAGKILTVGFMYSTANSLNKWRCIASAQEA